MNRIDTRIACLLLVGLLVATAAPSTAAGPGIMVPGPAGPTVTPSLPTDALQIYYGPMTVAFQVVQNGGPGGWVQVTYNTVVALNTPLTWPGSPSEQNPFNFQIFPYPAASNPQPGYLYLISAELEPNSPPPPTRIVIQHWTYTQNGSQFSGSMTSNVQPDPQELLFVPEFGGPLPGLVGYANVLKGSTISGRFWSNSLALTVQGGALFYNGMAVVGFQASFQGTLNGAPPLAPAAYLPALAR